VIIILTSDYHVEEKEEDGILMTEEDFKEAFAGGATEEGKFLECLEVSPLGRLMRFSNVR